MPGAIPFLLMPDSDFSAGHRVRGCPTTAPSYPIPEEDPKLGERGVKNNRILLWKGEFFSICKVPCKSVVSQKLDFSVLPNQIRTVLVWFAKQDCLWIVLCKFIFLP